LNPEGSSCGWLLSEILEWCHSREVVNSVNM
jgi:predicted DNA-binding transcriptional regulator AlpA